MVRTKTKISACVGLALAVPPMFAGAAGASTTPTPTSGPATSGPAANTSTQVQGDIVLYTASSSGAAPATNVGAFGGGGGWGSHFENVIWSTTNNTQVGVYYAKMERTAGSGDYHTDAHVALIRGGYEGDQVFNAFTDACANSSQKNATAQTCGSPGFGTSRGQVWTQAAGGGFDQGNNGSTEWSINGETDIMWTTP